jgi:diguanylate cyclase (GGDEF)-like protein
LAFYDPLTQLPNRRLLTEHLNQAMVACKRNGTYGAMMFLDLDNFKPLNDKHGHEAGDLLLVEVAQRLKNCVRGVDTLARLGGDEFVVMLTDLHVNAAESTAQALTKAEKIRASLAQPYLLTFTTSAEVTCTVEHHCTASIGVAMFSPHDTHHEHILQHADAAMYRAKAEGRNRVMLGRSPPPERFGS